MKWYPGHLVEIMYRVRNIRAYAHPAFDPKLYVWAISGQWTGRSANICGQGKTIDRRLTIRWIVNGCLTMCGGSGSTLRAAKDLGINCTSVDISKSYCDLLRVEMSQSLGQLR